MFMMCVCVKSFNKTKTKQNKTKQNKNKTKQNKTKQNKTKQNKTKQNKTKQNKTKQIHFFQVAVSYKDYNSPLQHTFHTVQLESSQGEIFLFI